MFLNITHRTKTTRNRLAKTPNSRYNIISYNKYQIIKFVKIYTRMPKKRIITFQGASLRSTLPYEIYGHCSWRTVCTLCSTIVCHDMHGRKFSVDKHRQSTKHHKALSSTSQQRQQPLSIPTASFDWNDYVGKVTAAFLSSDIPLYKLNNSDLQALFKCVGQKAPSESACRKRIDNMGKCEVAILQCNVKNLQYSLR